MVISKITDLWRKSSLYEKTASFLTYLWRKKHHLCKKSPFMKEKSPFMQKKYHLCKKSSIIMQEKFKRDPSAVEAILKAAWGIWEVNEVAGLQSGL